MKRAVIFPVFCLVALSLSYCTMKTDKPVPDELSVPDSTVTEVVEEVEAAPKEIIIEKELALRPAYTGRRYP